jgi:hypothetical protein
VFPRWNARGRLRRSPSPPPSDHKLTRFGGSLAGCTRTRRPNNASSKHHPSGQLLLPRSADCSPPVQLTFRVWLIGSALCLFGASVSQLFFFKSNAPSFSSFFIILLSLPLGRLAAATFPESINPGPFVSRGGELGPRAELTRCPWRRPRRSTSSPRSSPRQGPQPPTLAKSSLSSRYTTTSTSAPSAACSSS